MRDRALLLAFVVCGFVCCVSGLPTSTTSTSRLVSPKSSVVVPGCYAGENLHQGPIFASLRLRGGGNKARVNPFAALEGLSIERQNFIGFLFVMVLVPLEVEMIGTISRQKLVPAVLARKLTHILTGSTMFACLCLLPLGQSWSGRFAIAVVIHLFIVAFTVGAYIPDEDFNKLPSAIKERIQRLVDSCSRTGKRRELALGTLYYCIPSAMLIILCGTAPVTVFALSALYFGDGLADPVGRTLGSPKSLQYELKWYDNTKSYPGSLAFFLGSLGASLLYGKLFKWAGHYQGVGYSDTLFFSAAVWSAAVCTAVEAVCPPHLDNLLVPLASVMTTAFLSESGRIPFLLSTGG